MKEYYRVEADINLDAICRNVQKTRDIIDKNSKIMAVIKADGYGHGAVPIAKVLDKVTDAYGIAIAEEGIELRRAGISKPILVLGLTFEEQYEELIKYDITQTVCDYEAAQKISREAVRQKKTANVHIKVDTGMSRIGFAPVKESVETIKRIAALKNLKITGIFTHFACADKKDKTSFRKQFDKYKYFVDLLEKEGIYIKTKHVANSASIIDLPETNLDMVRSGISTYGLYPSVEVNKENLVLEQAMSILTKVVYLKNLVPGVGIGYGSTFVTQRPTKVATIPVGYGDGYPRRLSNKGKVLINGKCAPIIGRICMDQFMVDVTDIEDVKTGDTVTLAGKDGDEFISIDEIADMAGTFNYEFTCDIGKRIPRVYYYNGIKAGTLDFYDCTESTYDLNI